MRSTPEEVHAWGVQLFVDIMAFMLRLSEPGWTPPQQNRDTDTPVWMLQKPRGSSAWLNTTSLKQLKLQRVRTESLLFLEDHWKRFCQRFDPVILLSAFDSRLMETEQQLMAVGSSNTCLPLRVDAGRTWQTLSWFLLFLLQGVFGPKPGGRLQLKRHLKGALGTFKNHNRIRLAGCASLCAPFLFERFWKLLHNRLCFWRIQWRIVLFKCLKKHFNLI